MLLRIRRERMEAGITINDLAQKIGVSPSQLSQVEIGERRPSPSLRSRLARFYGKSDTELFQDIDSAHRLLRQLGGERASDGTSEGSSENAIATR